MEKNGMLTENSQSDFNHTKKAEYYDAEGYFVADEQNKHKLAKPEKLSSISEKTEE